MPYDLDYEELTRSLIENFNTLADEVQLLSDRKTILEHKLRFAHEQYQQLADRYAPGDAEISSTLAKLQVPPEVQISTPDRATFVPLPQRNQTGSKQQTAVAIRDGRRAAQRLANIGGSAGSSGRSTSGTSRSARRTSLSTVLEQDFTVPGKKSSLLCPFTKNNTAMKPPSQGSGPQDSDHPLTPADPTPHQSNDPICVALYTETMSSPPPSANGSAKCPIRYLDQHSPEEVARYFETHKHEIPRSHEICVKRYQRNEEDIRKLDAKYGNLVNMLQGLGQKHQPMLPAKEEEDEMKLDHASNERVENWAKAVSIDGIGHEEEQVVPEEEEDRDGRFDRPLKEIRVGESPSRPWGISVPFLDHPEGQRAVYPPPAPVSVEPAPKTVGKCPLGHGARQVKVEEKPTPPQPQDRPVGKCPFPHNQKARDQELPAPSLQPQPVVQAQPVELPKTNGGVRPQMVFTQPTFFKSAELQKMNGGSLPQMVFTGPVFIGYPMDQAVAFMQQYKSPQ